MSNCRLLEYVSEKLKNLSCLEKSTNFNDVCFQRYQKWKLILDVIRGKEQIQTYFDLALVRSFTLFNQET